MAEEEDVNWAVIPAAGLGTRMSENAVLGCKELIEIGGLTMLERDGVAPLRCGGPRPSAERCCALDGICAVHDAASVHWCGRLGQLLRFARSGHAMKR